MVIYYFFKSDWNHLVIDLFVVFLFLFFLELFVLLDQEYFILFLFPFFFLIYVSVPQSKKQKKYVIYQEFDATYALRMRTASTISLPRLRTLLPPQRRPSAPHCTNSRHPGRIGRPASSRRWHHQTG